MAVASTTDVHAPEPPGPRSWRPGGSLGAFRRDPLAFQTRMARTYGDVVRLSFFGRRINLVTHPDLVEEVLTGPARRYAKGIALDRARRLLGNGLLTAGGADHLRQRRMIQPLFHRQHIQRFAEAMVTHAARWADGLRPGAPMDMTHEMAGLTLAIVGDTLFSSDVQADAVEVREALTDAVAAFGLIFIPGVEWLERLPIPAFTKLRRARVRLDRIVRRIIAERRAEMETHAAGGPDAAPARSDLVTMLLAARDPENPDAAGMSDEQIRDEAMTIFLAGHETTANAMAWTWHLLAAAPEVESRLHRELRDVLGGRTPTAADVPRLEWTRAVVAETMRLWPPAWTVGRRALEMHTLGGYRIPQDSMVVVSQYVVHRDPRWWPNPDAFAPERWLEPAPDRPKYAYFPFGGGSRICIGESFAWTEAILLVATIAQRWRFRAEPGPGPTPEARITLRPKNLFMRAEGRDDRTAEVLRA